MAEVREELRPPVDPTAAGCDSNVSCLFDRLGLAINCKNSDLRWKEAAPLSADSSLRLKAPK